MDNKKETPFQIKLTKEQQKRFLKDLDKVEDLKSAIHFIKNYKSCIIVNRKFKKKLVKFSINSVASLTAIVVAMSLVKAKNNKDEIKVEKNPVETTITEEVITPTTEDKILTDKSIPKTMEEINNIKLENEIVDIPSIDEFVIEEDAAIEYDVPTVSFSFPKATNTNEESDYTNYYKVKDKYGEYIEKIAAESGVDARIIIAMIAQENPDEIDETSYGTYGPMCVTSIHNGETYNYYHYNDDGEYVNDPVTININNLKHFEDNMELYEDGKYGDITNADAWCIYYGVVILKNNYYQVNKTNDLTKEENVPLAILAYNHGYPDVIHCTRYSPTLFDACYSIRYTHAGDVNYDDDQYLEHVLNKIPDEELVKPFIFVDNDENKLCFNFERDNELAATDSREITKNFAL